jgi:hypothetical protein
MLTRKQFDQIAKAALDAVSWIEGWDAEHPSWVLTNGQARPSKALHLQLLDRLQQRGCPVAGWDNKNKRWRPTEAK